MINIPRIELTKDGLEKIKQEYESLLSERPLVLEDLKKARELGDLSENGYYKASRAKLSFIDNRVFRLKTIIKNARVVEPQSISTVSLGNTVEIKGTGQIVTYTLVSKYEADPSKGKISNMSPVGRAILGKRAGDFVTLKTPDGEKSFIIVKIRI